MKQTNKCFRLLIDFPLLFFQVEVFSNVAVQLVSKGARPVRAAGSGDRSRQPWTHCRALHPWRNHVRHFGHDGREPSDAVGPNCFPDLNSSMVDLNLVITSKQNCFPDLTSSMMDLSLVTLSRQNCFGGFSVLNSPWCTRTKSCCWVDLFPWSKQFHGGFEQAWYFSAILLKSGKVQLSPEKEKHKPTNKPTNKNMLRVEISPDALII